MEENKELEKNLPDSGNEVIEDPGQPVPAETTVVGSEEIKAEAVPEEETPENEPEEIQVESKTKEVLTEAEPERIQVEVEPEEVLTEAKPEKVPTEDIPEKEPVDPPVKSQSRKKKRLPLILAAVAVLLGAIYGGGYYYYSSHFPHAIHANGKKLGELTVEEAEKVFTDDLKAHSITLKEKEREEVIDAAAIGTVIDVGSQVKDLYHSLDPRLWFTNIFGKKDTTLTLDVTYDKEAMTAAVDSLECFKKDNVIAPKSTYIEAGEKEFSIVPEVLGNTVLKDKLVASIDDALATCKTHIDLEEEGLYKLPKYYAADEVVIKARDKANKYTHGTIVHDFTYATETIDYNTTKDWIKISKDFDVELSASLVGDYVESLGNKYNTMGSARPFTTAYGNKINVYDGDYGWRIDFQKEKKKLIKEIQSGKDVNRKPIYSYTAAIQTEKTDIGNSYVEVNLAAQELWLFIDGDCVLNTSVVTGKPPHVTHKGVYGITYKKRHEVLEGYNADGTPYASPVDYWMPFNGNQGLHDASWRDSFGGNIYKTNGSHGCVNCPVWAAAELYQYVDANFPVIIY